MPAVQEKFRCLLEPRRALPWKERRRHGSMSSTSRADTQIFSTVPAFRLVFPWRLAHPGFLRRPKAEKSRRASALGNNRLGQSATPGPKTALILLPGWSNQESEAQRISAIRTQQGFASRFCRGRRHPQGRFGSRRLAEDRRLRTHPTVDHNIPCHSKERDASRRFAATRT